MRRTAFACCSALCLAAWAVLSLSPAAAQQPTTISISTRAAEISDLLKQGQQFEIQRRWAEALTHYEEALRDFPNDAALQGRFNFARLHYDLGRRRRTTSKLPTGRN